MTSDFLLLDGDEDDKDRSFSVSYRVLWGTTRRRRNSRHVTELSWRRIRPRWMDLMMGQFDIRNLLSIGAVCAGNVSASWRRKALLLPGGNIGGICDGRRLGAMWFVSVVCSGVPRTCRSDRMEQMYKIDISVVIKVTSLEVARNNHFSLISFARPPVAVVYETCILTLTVIQAVNFDRGL